MEGVIFSLKDCQSIFNVIKMQTNCVITCGGCSASILLRQMLADILGCTVQYSTNAESAALGVALLAGVGSGIYNNVFEANNAVKCIGEISIPVRENTTLYEPYYLLYKELYEKLHDSFKFLSDI